MITTGGDGDGIFYLAWGAANASYGTCVHVSYGYDHYRVYLSGTFW